MKREVTRQQWQADLLYGASRLSLEVWLEIDTGMLRPGVPLQAVDQA